MAVAFAADIEAGEAGREHVVPPFVDCSIAFVAAVVVQIVVVEVRCTFEWSAAVGVLLFAVVAVDQVDLESK